MADFTAEQIAEMPDEKRWEWFRDKARIFHADGARWYRLSTDPENPNRMMYDGWREKPADEEDATDDIRFLELPDAQAA